MKKLYTLNHVANLQANKMMAFDDLYDQYAPALYGLIIKVAPNQEAADDIICKTFLKAYQNISTLKRDDSIFCWLLKYAIECGSGLPDKSKVKEWVVAARGFRT